MRADERTSPRNSQGQPAGRHVQLFGKAGWRISINSRSYFPGIDDPEINCMLVRAQEMARYVETGALDAGITGRDWVFETGSKVAEIGELMYSKQSLARRALGSRGSGRRAVCNP